VSLKVTARFQNPRESGQKETMRKKYSLYYAQRLIRFLKEESSRIKPLTILTHDHPDPDALASAWALAHLAQHVAKIRSKIVYGGIIGRAENRVMAERLQIPAYPLKPDEIKSSSHLALIDTQPPFRNNRCPPQRKPVLIIDHHPRHTDTRADCALIDESSGATTTILAEALILAGIKVPKRLATAIIYGIGSETQNLGREAGFRDIAAYQAFWPKANMQILWKIAYPKHSSNFFASLLTALQNAFICRQTIGTHLGTLTVPDRAAQIADFLLTHEKMTWSIVTGRYQGKLCVSLRSSDPLAGAGRLLRRLLGGGNRGGGHAMIAGGSIEIGTSAPEITWRHAEEKIAHDFFATQGMRDTLLTTSPFQSGR
jgi:nanoRNase/pAp phosphatase (c-di-AMP/oligoRNAs hydrolase)